MTTTVPAGPDTARISRRQVLALIALQTDLPEPRGVAFVEPPQTNHDCRIDVDLDSIAELRAWLPFFGMTEKRVSSQPYTHEHGAEKGQTTTLANAYNFDGWRGWCVHLHALDPVPALDDATREQLQAIADSSAAHRQVAGSVGAPGQCSAECSCGVVFGGFDTIAEAAALLDSHIAVDEPVTEAGAE